MGFVACRLNEEMIETLFVVKTPKTNPNEATRWQVLPPPAFDNGDKVLDPKKSQNIAILLKALHVTVDEVCEGLSEGIIQHFLLFKFQISCENCVFGTIIYERSCYLSERRQC